MGLMETLKRRREERRFYKEGEPEFRRYQIKEYAQKVSALKQQDQDRKKLEQLKSQYKQLDPNRRPLRAVKGAFARMGAGVSQMGGGMSTIGQGYAKDIRQFKPARGGPLGQGRPNNQGYQQPSRPPWKAPSFEEQRARATPGRYGAPATSVAPMPDVGMRGHGMTDVGMPSLGIDELLGRPPQQRKKEFTI